MQDDAEKEELLRNIRSTRNKGQEIVQFTRDLQAEGQFMVDLANATEQVIKDVHGPVGISWTVHASQWKRAEETSNTILSGLYVLPMATYSSSASGTAYQAIELVATRRYIDYVPESRQPEALRAAEKLNQVLGQAADKQRAADLMRRFDLDRVRPGKKSAVELFETAWAAYEQPVLGDSPVSTSLIPARGSIELIVQALLCRRQKQEKAINQAGKILSIGRQTKKEGITELDVCRWADRWTKLNDELSSAKEGSFSRDEWRDSLRRATLFIIEVLEGLDPAKLK